MLQYGTSGVSVCSEPLQVVFMIIEFVPYVFWGAIAFGIYSGLNMKCC